MSTSYRRRSSLVKKLSVLEKPGQKSQKSRRRLVMGNRNLLVVHGCIRSRTPGGWICLKRRAGLPAAGSESRRPARKTAFAATGRGQNRESPRGRPTQPSLAVEIVP